MAVTEPIDVIEATDATVRAARKSRLALAEAAGRTSPGASGTVLLDDVELPVGVLRALTRMVNELSEGHDVALHTVSAEDAELTTTQAARLLGISRPTLIDVLESGALPYRMVGTHRRLRLHDVLAYREEAGRLPAPPSEEEMLRGLREMAEFTNNLRLGY